MFNSNLSVADIATGFMNIGAIAYALYWNVRGSLTGILVHTRTQVAVLSSIYFIAYFILLFTDISPAEWSSWLRGLGPVVFIIVWGGPAKKGIKEQTKLIDELDRKVTDRIGRGRQDDD